MPPPAAIDGRSLTPKVAALTIAFLAFGLFLANGLFQRGGRKAIDREVAVACYDRAGWLATELEATLDASGSPTEDSRALLYRAAQQMDVSLVMFYEADQPLLTAHGPSLSAALRVLKKYPKAGKSIDSGETPWVPSFDTQDRTRYPDRNSRPVRVQEHFPFSIETPVGSRTSLRIVPLRISPSGAGLGTSLAFVGLLLALAAVLATGRVLRPLQRAADGIARLGRGDSTRVMVQGTGEIARMARAANRIADGVVVARADARRVLDNLASAFQGPVELAAARVEQIDPSSLSEDAREDVEALCDEVRGLTAVTDALRLWTDLEAGQIELESAPSDLSELIDEVVGPWVEADNQVNIHIAEDIEQLVTLDPHHMRIVLAELTDNALRHGGDVLDIEVTRGHTKVELVFRDHGAGISDMEQLRKIFEPFYRSDDAAGPGLGLGLRLVRVLMELHQGGVSLRNHPDGGLEALLWLPASPIRVTEVDRAIEALGWAEESGPVRVPTLPPEPPAPVSSAPSTPAPVQTLSPDEARALLDPPEGVPGAFEEPVTDPGAPLPDSSDVDVVSSNWSDPMEPDHTGRAAIGPVPIPPQAPPSPPQSIEEDPYEPF